MKKDTPSIDSQELTIPGRSKNELLEMHGPSRYLITRLGRYAFTGWLAFFMAILTIFAMSAIYSLKQVPVLAVDGSGRVLGTFEYLDPTTRTDEEVIAGSKYFLDRYLSFNSSTIYNDYAAAMSMMGEELRATKMEEITSIGYLPRVEESKSHSFNEYSRDDGAVIIARRELLRAVRLKGFIVITLKNGNTLEKPFDVTLDLKVVPRNTFVTSGIEIQELRDN